VSEVPAVQRGDAPVRDEGDRDRRSPRALRAQHGTRDARRALAPERDAARLRGDLHVEPGGRHTGENSAVTPPLDAG
jgi:hypothetical protein